MDEPSTEKKSGKKKKPIKRKLLLAVAILVVGYLLYFCFVRTTNETGWAGADKYGRQVLIQTLNDYTKSEGVGITSDFTDHSVWERMLVGEPMRTVIRYDSDQLGNSDGSGLKKHLAQPYTSITDHYTDKITLREDYSQPMDELMKTLDKHKARSLGDFYAAFGFKQVELSNNGKIIVVLNLTGTDNKRQHGVL